MKFSKFTSRYRYPFVLMAISIIFFGIMIAFVWNSSANSRSANSKQAISITIEYVPNDGNWRHWHMIIINPKGSVSIVFVDNETTPKSNDLKEYRVSSRPPNEVIQKYKQRLGKYSYENDVVLGAPSNYIRLYDNNGDLMKTISYSTESSKGVFTWVKNPDYSSAWGLSRPLSDQEKQLQKLIREFSEQFGWEDMSFERMLSTKDVLPLQRRLPLEAVMK